MWVNFTFIKLFETSFNDEFTFHKTVNLKKNASLNQQMTSRYKFRPPKIQSNFIRKI